MHPAPLAVMDYVGPALGALVFVAVMSLVAEPTRRTLNAIILAGASGVVLERRLRSVGIDLPGHRRGDRVSCATIVPMDRCRLADSRGLGYCASPVGQSHLAVYAEFRVRLHDFRQLDCAVVPRWRAIVPEAPAHRDAHRRCVKSLTQFPSTLSMRLSAYDLDFFTRQCLPIGEGRR